MIPIHNHSHFSALDGYGTPEEIGDRLLELDMSGAFITDHGNVAGWSEWQRMGDKKGLFTGYGAELYQARTHRSARPEQKNTRDGAHLILLAQTPKGYHNIRHLADEANRSGFYYSPRVDWELLDKYKEGVIATSACIAGLVSQGIKEGTNEYLDKFLNIFRDRFYLEIHTYDSEEQQQINLELWSIAQKRGIPVVIANDAHYCRKEDWELHETLMAVQFNKPVDLDNPLHPPCLYIQSERDVRLSLDYLNHVAVDQAIRNTEVVAELCTFDPGRPGRHLPRFPSRVENNNLLLIDEVEEGLRERYGEFSPEVQERTEFELEAIIDAGLADYFLIVADIVSWSHKHGIMTGCGRGSSAGSILAYALGITTIDPLKHKLYFERFWNPGRTDGLPDIDVDIETKRREDVKEYLAQKYGRDRVLSIGAYSTMGPKAAIRRVMKALHGADTNYIDIDAISKILQTTTDAGLTADWEAIHDQAGDELDPYVQKYPDVFRIAEKFTDRITHFTTHASGVVVSDVDLPEELPSRQDRKQNLLVTQVDMREVEKAGFVKIDLLGLRNLDTLKKTIQLAGVPDFDFSAVPYFSLPDSYWEQIEKGYTLGFFQIEDGDSAKRIGKEVKCRSIDDLAAIIALNRPGPLRTGATERFIKCRAGQEPRYQHPLLESILEPTYGEMIYQEQVLEYFRAIGYSLSEADEIRKILGKKLVEAMEKEKPRYLERASQYMDELVAEEILHGIEEFAKYSFNKSHAVGYGTILAWTMYAKWKWPTEFILASILTVDDAERVARFVSEGRRLGITISPPDVNYSEVGVGKHGDKIYFGLSNIKGIGKPAAKWIIDHRPYLSYEDFMEAYEEAQVVWEEDKRGKSPRQTIRANQIEAVYNAGGFDGLGERELTLEEKATMEEELLGVALTDVVGEIIERNKSQFDALSSFKDLEEETSDSIPVPGIVTTIRKSRVRADARRNAGEEFAWVSIEWEGDSATFAAFPEEYKRFKFMLRPRVVGRFDLKVSKRGPVMTKGMRFV